MLDLDWTVRRHGAIALCLCALLATGCTVGDGDVGPFDDASFSRDAAAQDAGAGGRGGGGAVDPDDDAGSDPDGGQSLDAGGGEATPGMWPAAYADALCDALETCYGSAELLRDALDGDDCSAREANTLGSGPLIGLGASVAAGFVIWRPGELDGCLQDIRELGCDVRSVRAPASCELLIAGTVPLDGDCMLNEECSGDAFCDFEASPTCPGTCTELEGQGVACSDSDDAQCEDGLVCPTATGICEPLGEIADTCGAGLAGCKPGLECVDGECTTIAAIYFLELGDTCDPFGDRCLPELVCASVSASAGMCAERVGLGESCRRATPNQCPASQYCPALAGEIATCTDFPGDGEPCLTQGMQPCATGATCIDETCRELKHILEDCIHPRQCWSGVCDSEDGQCVGQTLCDP